ncbi:hypothetical protein LJR255_000921 [Pararhizobium sp. LjRoot255]|uniref:hypothetical protein n=1 Tax=Pararhizobium sp. LjRoot255 TaxID=3342298 RepID=UPI003ECD6E01
MPVSANYLPLFVVAAFALAVFLWVEWQGRIQPLFIPHAEIARLADELVTADADRAEELAAIEEDRAWRYSENFEQGKWRRVRRELERRGIRK